MRHLTSDDDSDDEDRKSSGKRKKGGNKSNKSSSSSSSFGLQLFKGSEELCDLDEGVSREPLKFQIESITWKEDKTSVCDYIECTGTTYKDNKSIKVDIPCRQFFRLKLPEDTVASEVPGIIKEIKKQLGNSYSIVDYKFEELVPARPFRFGRKEKVVSLFFNKMWAYKKVMKDLQNYTSDEEDEDIIPGTILMKGRPTTVIMYETDIHPAARWAQTTHLNTTGWMVVDKWKELQTSRRKLSSNHGGDNHGGDDYIRDSRYDENDDDEDDDDDDTGGKRKLENVVQTYYHIRAEHKDISLEKDEVISQSVPDYTSLVFDIETSGLNVFDNDAILFQISCIKFRSSDYSIEPILFTWNPFMKDLDHMSAKVKKLAVEAANARGDERYRDVEIDGVKVVNLASEKEVLEHFIEYYRETDPGNIVGHNIYGFDLNYLIVRAKHHSIQEYEYLGRTGTKNAEPKKNMNRREVMFHDLPGRITFDTMFFCAGYDKAQTSYSLESCTEMHLKDLDTAMINDPKLHPLHRSILRRFAGKGADAPLQPPKDKGEKNEEKREEREEREEKKEEKKDKLDNKEEKKDKLDIKEEKKDKLDNKEEKKTSQKGGKGHAKLASAAPSMLDKYKGDIAGEDIGKYFYSQSYEKRKELGHYCVKDTLLTLRLFVERLMFMKTYKMGQAFRAPMQVVLTSGAGERVMPNMLTQMHLQGILFNKYHDVNLDPYRELWDWKKYPGGLVRDPKKGKYLTPVTVLDFGGMYPSIMMEYKICTQTLLPWRFLTDEDKIELEENYNYIRKNVHGEDLVIIQGVKDPSKTSSSGYSFVIQENMKKWREVAKDNKKKAGLAKDGVLEAIYDCEQGAYKIYMNGMYGLYAPVQGGKFTYLLVAASITQFGREMSQDAGDVVLNCDFLKGLNPYMVYGDTDSFMYTHDYPEFKDIPDIIDENGKVIKKGKSADVQRIEFAFNLNSKVAKVVTAFFKSDYIVVELEKHYYPMILFDKKKYYCGIKWLGYDKDPVTKELVLRPPESKPDIVGIEGKKRDRCEHLRELQYRIISYLLQTRSTDAEIEETIYDALMALAHGKVPLEKLIIVKGLSKSIEDYNGKKIPHVMVAQKNEARGNTESSKKGSRVRYIVGTTEDKYKDGGRQAKKKGVSFYCEDADYFISKKLKPDPVFYINNHYKKAIEKLLAPVNIDVDKLFGRPAGTALRTANIGQTSILDTLPELGSSKLGNNSSTLHPMTLTSAPASVITTTKPAILSSTPLSEKKTSPSSEKKVAQFKNTEKKSTSVFSDFKQTQLFFGNSKKPPTFIEKPEKKKRGVKSSDASNSKNGKRKI